MGAAVLLAIDLGSGGPLVLPDAAGSASHRFLVVGSGKDGTIYVGLAQPLVRVFEERSDGFCVRRIDGEQGGAGFVTKRRELARVTRGEADFDAEC